LFREEVIIVTTFGGKKIAEMLEHLKQRQSEVDGWAEKDANERVELLQKWAAAWMREDGLFADKAIEETAE
jgi:acyl-CoA reductase-like NAD-dependent aldehyde dehydrogenase